MTRTHWRPIFVWTIAWGMTGAALYISGVFSSPRSGPLWVALTVGAISWSIAGASTFSIKYGGSTLQWSIAILVIWTLAYLVSLTLAGLILNSSAFGDTIIGLLVAFIGWSVGAALAAFLSTWLTEDHSKLRRSSLVQVQKAESGSKRAAHSSRNLSVQSWAIFLR